MLTKDSIHTRILLFMFFIVTLLVGIYIFLSYSHTRQTLWDSSRDMAYSVLTAGITARHESLVLQENPKVLLSQLRELGTTLENAKSNEERLKLIRDSRYYSALPTTVGLAVAQSSVAKESGVTVQYQQSPARFAEQEMNEFAKQVIDKEIKPGNDPFVFELDWTSLKARAFYPIAVQPGDLLYHGAITDDPDGNGYDPMGIKMEGWKTGEYHSGYYLEQDVKPLFEKAISKFFMNSLWIALGGVTLAVMLSSLVTYLINHALKPLIRIAKAIAAGDLTVQVDTHSRDEMSPLRSAMKQMVESLANLVRTTKENADGLFTFTKGFLFSSEKTGSGVVTQAKAVEEILDTLTHMSISSREVAQYAMSASDSAREAHVTTVQGKTVVQQASYSIGQLVESVAHTTSVMSELRGDSEKIGTVLSVINGIADQTNLLALNAAIESARAGDAGRGFSVVASEVRALAKRTQESTREIRIMVEKIQKSAHQAASAMTSGASMVQDSVEHMSEVDKTLHHIDEMIDTISEMNAHIATSTESQSAGVDDIKQRIIKFQAIIHAVEEEVATSRGMSNQLDKLVKQSEVAIRQFHIRDR